jgi:hypothetical protein
VEGNLVLSSKKLSDTTLGGVLVTGATFGLDATGIGDVNGDSIEDIAVGARTDDSGGTNRGSFWLIFLDAAGNAVPPSPLLFSDTLRDPLNLLTLETENAHGAGDLGSFFGDGLAVLPDLDADGTAEVKLAVGASGGDPAGTPVDSGALYLVDIRKSDWTISGVVTIRSGSSGFTTLDPEDRWAQRVTRLGDWDGDGMPELGAGAFGDDDGGGNNGAFYILYLEPDGSGVKTHVKLSATQGGFDGALDGSGSFGTKGADVGDLDGDEQPDLVVGASSDGPAGSIYTIFMDPDCATNTTSVPHPLCVAKPGAVRIRQGEGGLAGPLQSASSFGVSVSFLPDPGGATGRVAVGAHLASSNTGELWILRLHGDGTVASEERLASGVNGLPTILSASSIGVTSNPVDFGGNGLQDLIAGAFADSTGGTNTGAAYLIELDGCTTIVTHPIVFHSPGDDGANPCVPIQLGGGSSQTLHLYLETGTAPSSVPANVCQAETANGDELCAWDVRIAVDPPMYIVGFDPDVLIEDSIRSNGSPWGPPEEPDTLRLAWIGPSTPTDPTAGPIRIGDLTIGGLGGGGGVRVAAGSAAVGAARQILPIATKTIGLPEPAATAGLLCGGALLAWLVRRRARRGALRRRATARIAALLCATPCLGLLLASAQAAHAAISVKGQKRILDPLGDEPVSGSNGWARSPIALGDLGGTSDQGDGSPDLVIGDSLGTGGNDASLNPTFLDQNENRLGYAVIGGATDYFGYSIANLGDIDGDGRVDLLVGAPDPGNVITPSTAQILELAEDGTEVPGSRTTILSSVNTSNDYLGIGVAALGDIDGDGLIEVAVGESSPQNVYLLSLDPITRSVVNTLVIDEGELPFPLQTGFGAAVTGIGDLDGDEVTDLAIGAPETNDHSGSCPGLNRTGAVWIVFLQVNGASTFGVKGYQKISETHGGLRLCLPQGSGTLETFPFGGALASHGDALDIAGRVLYVGAATGNIPEADTGFYALALRPDGSVRKAYKISHSAGVGFVNQDLTTNRFGGSLGALPDMNGDETFDLAVGDTNSGFTGGDPNKAESVYILYMQDTDHDGLDDNLDLCPDVHDPLQEDADADGVGDLCDNCVDLANTSQADGDADGEGDVCEPVEVRLQTTGTPASPSWDVSLQCGAYTVSHVNGAIVMPAGASNPKTLTLNGASVGSALVSGPGLGSPPGVRSDAIYFQAVGNGAGNRLCTALDPPISLGTLTTGAISGTQLAAAALSGEGVGTPGFGLAIAMTSPTVSVPLTDIRLVNGIPLPILDLELGPAVETATGTRWEVRAVRASDEFHRVAFGLIAPSGTDAPQMRWRGCDTTPDGNGARLCCESPPCGDFDGLGVGTNVNPNRSFTVGPQATPPGTQLPHTMYVVLEGSALSSGTLDTVNPVSEGQYHILGEVELSSSPDLEPAMTHDGVNDVTAPPSLGGGTVVPLVDVDAAPRDIEQVKLIGAFNPSDDLDGDGIQDLGDNCPFIDNTAQTNLGSFGIDADDSDAFGDACQCGESSGDGAILGPATPDPDPLDQDFEELWNFLAGNLTNPIGIAERCSVVGTTECNIRDLLFLRQALDTAAPSVATRCDAALSPPSAP